MQRSDAITGMRGLAALLVVGFHAVLVVWLAQVTLGLRGDAAVAQDAFEHPLSGWLLGGGWLGVDFFFVLSGFLLGWPLLASPRALPGRPQYRVFAAKRLLRIAPPYYASIVATFLLIGHTGSPYYAVTWDSLLTHLLYLHSFVPGHLLAINAVYWTLAIELQFYLLLPLLALPFRRYGPAAAAPFMAVALLYSWWVWRTFPAFEDARFAAAQFPAFLGHFAVGLAAASLLQRGWHTRQPDAWLAAFLAAFLVAPAALLGYTWAFEGPDHPLYHVVLRPAAGVAFAALVALALQPGSVAGRALACRPLVAVGDVSYSLYLLHLPVAGVLLVHDPAAVIRLGVAAYVLVTVAASLVVAALFYVAVERPSLRLKDAAAARLQGATHA